VLVGIGNGWIDPWNQYPAYYEFALEAGILKEGSDTDKSVT
jgi:carboxypeptidase D